MSAIISEDGRYRYRLERRWGFGSAVAFIMLNPSTADANVDDPTIRKCMGFAKRWNYGGMIVGNLFALRATNPVYLYADSNPIGPDNDQHLARIAKDASQIVCAWGTHGDHLLRGEAVKDMLVGYRLQALKITKDGHPGHPLYVKGDTELLEFGV